MKTNIKPKMALIDPWSGKIETFYWPNNICLGSSKLFGAIGLVFKGNKWEWAIEIFLGSIWHGCGEDFEAMVKKLSETWLHEFLHMIYRWEKGNAPQFFKALLLKGGLSEEDEIIINKWLQLLLMEDKKGANQR